MNQLKRIYKFNFVADLVMAEAISATALTRPPGLARLGRGAGSRACASAATGRATSPWNAPSPPTAAPSVAGWFKVELQTIHRFSQSWRRLHQGPSPGRKGLLAFSHLRHYEDTMLNEWLNIK